MLDVSLVQMLIRLCRNKGSFQKTLSEERKSARLDNELKDINHQCHFLHHPHYIKLPLPVVFETFFLPVIFRFKMVDLSTLIHKLYLTIYRFISFFFFVAVKFRLAMVHMVFFFFYHNNAR